jgi:hypothetical protein
VGDVSPWPCIRRLCRTFSILFLQSPRIAGHTPSWVHPSVVLLRIANTSVGAPTGGSWRVGHDQRPWLIGSSLFSFKPLTVSLSSETPLSHRERGIKEGISILPPQSGVPLRLRCEPETTGEASPEGAKLDAKHEQRGDAAQAQASAIARPFAGGGVPCNVWAWRTTHIHAGPGEFARPTGRAQQRREAVPPPENKNTDKNKMTFRIILLV